MSDEQDKGSGYIPVAENPPPKGLYPPPTTEPPAAPPAPPPVEVSSTDVFYPIVLWGSRPVQVSGHQVSWTGRFHAFDRDPEGGKIFALVEEDGTGKVARVDMELYQIQFLDNDQEPRPNDQGPMTHDQEKSDPAEGAG